MRVPHFLCPLCWVDILVSTFWWLWMVLLGTFVYEFLFKHLLSFFWAYCTGSGIARLYGDSVFTLLRRHQAVFHIQELYRFAILLSVYRVPVSSDSVPTFSYGLSSGCKVVSHCGLVSVCFCFSYQMWLLFSWQALFYRCTLGTSHGKNRSFFSLVFFPFFFYLIKNEIGPKNIERNKFKFTKNCTLSKSH